MTATRRTLLPFALLASTGLFGCAAHAGIEPVTDEHCALMKEKRVIRDDNPVGCDRLRVVTFKHHDFEGNDSQTGKIMVLDAVANHVKVIFDTLHERGFALAKARLMEEYGADDDKAMEDNNTSAFNGRQITGGTSWSIHAYGVAFDINPLQNPYIAIDTVGGANIKPIPSARTAVNRLDHRPDKPNLQGKVEDLVGLFADNGFLNWGGYWNYPIDYQHFEPGTRAFVRRLGDAPPAEAQRIFEDYVKGYRDCVASQVDKPEPVARQVCAEQSMRG